MGQKNLLDIRKEYFEDIQNVNTKEQVRVNYLWGRAIEKYRKE